MNMVNEIPDQKFVKIMTDVLDGKVVVSERVSK